MDCEAGARYAGESLRRCPRPLLASRGNGPIVERLEKLEGPDEAARLFLGATIRGIFDEIARLHEGAGAG